MRNFRPRLRALSCLALCLAVAGCTVVKPWQREKLASPCMRSPFAKTALAKKFGPLLLTARHRFYAQTQASFYRAVYRDRAGFQAGDARLGRLYGQTGGLEAELPLSFKARCSGPRASLEYVFSRLEFPDLYPRTLYGHVITMRVTGEF